MIGRKFGRLTVAEALGSNKHQKRIWRCECECGKEAIANTGDLNNGHVKSCGCLLVTDPANLRHGKRRSKIYTTWINMRSRCNNPNRPEYHNYGGRGITVCSEWMDDFNRFYSDMGDVPDAHSLGRIDNDLGYSKDNCRWETREQQALNTRQNRFITKDGKTQTIKEWADELGIPVHRIYCRLHLGWDDERAIATGDARRSRSQALV